MLAQTLRCAIKNQKIISNTTKFQIPVANFVNSKINNEEKKSTKLWGGRFSKDTNQCLKNWTQSITCDSNFVAEDIWGSMAHVTMLGRQGIVPIEKSTKIVHALVNLQDKFNNGEWELGYQQEDVHMNVEAEMIRQLGMDIGGRMHTTRSRNDQVVTDSKLYTRKRLLELRGHVVEAVKAFLKKAEGQLDKEMVAYTHVQHAQPVSVAFWLTHYAAILLRDLERLKNAYDRTDTNPLGSGAISGTSFPIDRELTTKLLGFQKVHVHALDATSARDFMWESLCAAGMLSNTLSRLAEEFILWSSYEFSTLTLDDGFAMGSSMMPQKKNPGALELMRGRCGRMTGYVNAGFILTKGLPSGYNRDFHEDKEITIYAMNTINKMVEIVPALIETTTINQKRMAELCFGNFATATEVANYLVAKHDVPFREAHHVVGSLVGELYRSGQNFSNFEFCIDHIVNKHNIKADAQEIKDVLDPKTVMLSYNSLGGTGDKSVAAITEDLHKQLEGHVDVLQQDNNRVNYALESARKIAFAQKDVTSVDQLQAVIAKYF